MKCKKCKEIISWVEEAERSASPVDEKKLISSYKEHLEMLHEMMKL